MATRTVKLPKPPKGYVWGHYENTKSLHLFRNSWWSEGASVGWIRDVDRRSDEEVWNAAKRLIDTKTRPAIKFQVVDDA